MQTFSWDKIDIETYSWKKVDKDFGFNLWILNQPIFGCMTESVEFHLGNFILYESSLDRKNSYVYFKNITIDNISQYFKEYDYIKSEFSYDLTTEEFDEFKCWLLTSLTSVTNQRMKKINKIKERMLR